MHHPPVETVAELEALDQDEIVAGYRAGIRGAPEPGPDHSKAYAHGWRNGMVDSRRMPMSDAQRKLSAALSRLLPVVNVAGEAPPQTAVARFTDQHGVFLTGGDAANLSDLFASLADQVIRAGTLTPPILSLLGGVVAHARTLAEADATGRTIDQANDVRARLDRAVALLGAPAHGSVQ